TLEAALTARETVFNNPGLPYEQRLNALLDLNHYHRQYEAATAGFPARTPFTLNPAPGITEMSTFATLPALAVADTATTAGELATLTTELNSRISALTTLLSGGPTAIAANKPQITGLIRHYYQYRRAIE